MDPQSIDTTPLVIILLRGSLSSNFGISSLTSEVRRLLLNVLVAMSFTPGMISCSPTAAVSVVWSWRLSSLWKWYAGFGLANMVRMTVEVSRWNTTVLFYGLKSDQVHNECSGNF